MQTPLRDASTRSIRSLVASSSSARMLNLHGLAAQNLVDPDYLERPLFAHPVLNRAIIVKYNVGPSEADRLAPRRFNATKILFPFDPSDLELGAQFLFVDQQEFVSTLTRRLNYAALSLDRDVEVLRILDELPTLDPFLIHENLTRRQIEVGRCYFQLNETDRNRMLGSVTAEIEALVRLCFGEAKSVDGRARLLSQLLLANQESPELEPLRETFRMQTPEFSEAMFAWKAFLYYRWRSRVIAPQLRSTLNSVAAISAGRYDIDQMPIVMRAKQRLEETAGRAWREVGQRLKLYDKAFAALTERKNPEAFRAFLKQGPDMVLEVGQRIGQLELVIGFWDYRFGDRPISAVAPDTVFEGMRDLLQALSVALSPPAKKPKSPV